MDNASQQGSEVSISVPDDDAFCIMPWIHMHALPNGNVYPCCLSDSAKPFSTTSEPTVLDMVNSEPFRELRRNMLSGRKTDSCSRCYHIESMGAKSHRHHMNRDHAAGMMDDVTNTNPDGSIDRFSMRYLDIRWSNICNMKCRSCGPGCSSQWAQEHRERFGESGLGWITGGKIILTNNEDDAFWRKVEPYLDDVEEVNFAGGESLITPEHYRILDHWLGRGMERRVKIVYTTNFSVFGYKKLGVVDYWKRFDRVEIYASLDASGSLGEYLRKGTVWSEVEDNVRMLKREVPHVSFQITPTITIWNVHQLPLFHRDWLDKGLLSPDDDTRLNIATFPRFAAISALPRFYKDRVLPSYRAMAGDPRLSQRLRDMYQSVINAMERGREDKNLIRQFFDYNLRLDQHRGESLLGVIPELRDVYDWSRWPGAW